MNSDQGCQFTSDVYVSLLHKEGIRISMDGKGRAIDNIFVERLWRSIKYEHIYLYAYDDGLSLYQGLSRYFEFYNHERLHQSLDYSTTESEYLMNQEHSSGRLCWQLAIFSQHLTTENIHHGEPHRKYRPTSENQLDFKGLLS